VVRISPVAGSLQFAFGGVTRLLPPAEAASVWVEIPALPPPGHEGDWHETPATVDPSAVLLARLRIPAAPAPDAASAPVPDWTAAAWPDPDTHLDNTVRNFLFPTPALRHLAGV